MFSTNCNKHCENKKKLTLMKYIRTNVDQFSLPMQTE